MSMLAQFCAAISGVAYVLLLYFAAGGFTWPIPPQAQPDMRSALYRIGLLMLAIIVCGGICAVAGASSAMWQGGRERAPNWVHIANLICLAQPPLVALLWWVKRRMMPQVRYH